MSLSISSWKKFFIMIWNCLILVIYLNILSDCQILLIPKDISLLKAFTSKSGTLSDVTVTVYLNK